MPSKRNCNVLVLQHLKEFLTFLCFFAAPHYLHAFFLIVLPLTSWASCIFNVDSQVLNPTELILNVISFLVCNVFNVYFLKDYELARLMFLGNLKEDFRLCTILLFAICFGILLMGFESLPSITSEFSFCCF